MKLVHVSDIHINPAQILGHDPIANFRACIAHIAEHQADADRIVITGDLTHHGQPESYEILKSILAESGLTGDLAPRLLVGNHDNRDNFRAAFPDAADDGDGYVQWVEEVPAGLFIYLDTLQHSTHAGGFDAIRRAWLRETLENARNQGLGAWIFMHHNPAPVHVANADVIGLIEEAEFQQILKDYHDTVRHIFFGHCHYTLSGAVHGVPFSAPRSTCHTCWPDFSGIVERMGYGDLVPNYNVCFLGETSTIIHSIDFLDEDKVRWRLD